jgi:hypothetical protein
VRGCTPPIAGIRSGEVNAWVFLWLMLFLKIPLVALFLLVRWAVKQTPEPASESDGGIGPSLRPRHPHHPRSRPPRLPRRGPHGDAPVPSPARVRTAATRKRLPTS